MSYANSAKEQLRILNTANDSGLTIPHALTEILKWADGKVRPECLAEAKKELKEIQHDNINLLDDCQRLRRELDEAKGIIR